MEKLCSKCKKRPQRLTQRYCLECHKEYMRAFRPAYRDLSPEEKKKSVARAYANVYQKRGKIVLQPCSVCLSPNAQKHHEDYDKPLEVRWLCRKCHVEWHRQKEKEEKNAVNLGSCNA